MLIMAAHVPIAPGYLQMLRAGTKYFTGLYETLFSNISACKALVRCLRGCYGPRGSNKLVVNHFGKIFLTSDAATILKELEIENPAAKLLRTASESQEQEVGDGTNFVVLLAGGLLENAEGLLKLGLPVSDVTAGYEMASKEVLKILKSVCCSSVEDIRDVVQTARVLQTVIASKLTGYEEFLSKLVAESCISVLTPEGQFNADNVRVCKIIGASILHSSLLEGMVFKRTAEGLVTSVMDANVAIYSCGFGMMNTETTGTVLLESAADLISFGSCQEDLIAARVLSISNTGVNVIVVAGKVEDLGLYYADKYKLMVVKMTSRNDMRHLAKATGATILMTLIPPLDKDIGHCDQVYLDEIGDVQVVIFKKQKRCSSVATIILRGSTEELLSNVEQGVTNAVKVYKVLTMDPTLVPGAGATEIELCVKLRVLGITHPGTEHYGILEFVHALESLPRALAENAGLNVNEAMASLKAVHQLQAPNVGLNLVGDGPDTVDAAKAGILDPFLVKHWGIKLATNVAVTLLGISHIVMAKKSGGPKPRGENPNWDLEPDMID
ncbi:T-complex protein 1 subunit theta-like isoform X1 [Lissotriton helveticus]